MSRNKKVEVLMSDAIYKGDWREEELKGRTFSFVNLDYDPSGGQLQIRVEKTFGNSSDTVILSPNSYNISHTTDTSGKETIFNVENHTRYISVHFKGGDNQTSPNKWIKHMLCIFIDPIEIGTPDKTGYGVTVYSDSVSSSELKNANIIYLPAGYHNLRDYTNGGIISNDGQLTF